MRTVVHAAAIDAGETPPREFRIFKAGANSMPNAHGAEGTGGVFYFTAASAERVMAEYIRHGVDMMVDLEHESTDPQAIRADSRDARGWFKLEVRGGELWAVDVKWTPDGERRLNERTQRYISPTFGVDRDTCEVVDLVACALVAKPATHGAPALVAASTQTVTLNAAETASLGVALARRLRAVQTRATLGRNIR